MDRDRFKALIHYVCSQTPNRLSLGKTKLNKILWFSERDCYLSGEPISKVPFIKMQFGPVPQSIDTYLRELGESGAVLMRETEWDGKRKYEFISLREPSLEGFSARQVSIINRAIQQICSRHTAESISKASHDEVWDAAAMGERIPLYAAFGKRGELSEDDLRWASVQLQELGMSAG